MNINTLILGILQALPLGEWVKAKMSKEPLPPFWAGFIQVLVYVLMAYIVYQVAEGNIAADDGRKFIKAVE